MASPYMVTSTELRSALSMFKVHNVISPYRRNVQCALSKHRMIKPTSSNSAHVPKYHYVP
jgi:hypothetical protein